ncbi:phosphate ABC transporter substrate-binding protein PstS family protein [Ectobacillus antri]|jgi:phosphate transport system substrate-binding protein|uniref:Phosphate-binding protein n=1 Tax=Ectobacillus antri TaxID=2486280 RepID=A0ABT6H509_9BACI|nr:phosphate ABC transporter substrate-binding protein PstS family protein [Ectobacillus antri]MDG4657430.1 phosphate ABC transporter substrate-binding protein PstS family protein [Ectobacillus antri]MDG5754439.1 phosphate ABC transporter substrate-binding protein PstS family protein [Ectobacillus antri]
MIKKGFKFTLAAFMITGALAACGKSEDTATDTNKEPKQELSGTIAAAGSTALQPLAEEAASAFMGENPNVSITVQGGGSGTGINQVASGAVQIGNSDIPAAEKLDAEKAKELVDNKVAGIAFGIVVNKDVTVTNLTLQQIQDIFSGKITNWKEVGGKDEKINVINRPASSGTRATFEKTILKGTKANDAIGTTQDSNGAVEQAINSTPGSVSYLAMSYMVGDKKGALKTVKIENASPTTADIAAGKYPFWAYQYMVTKGEAKDAVKAYIDYIKGKDFEKTVEEMGYIPMTKLNK